MPVEEVERAELAFGRGFGASYREFLLRYGGAIVGSLEILGLRNAEVMGNTPSVVETTNRFRRQGWPGVEGWLIISEDGFGNPIGLLENDELWISDHDTGEIRMVAASFDELISSLLDGTGY